MSRTKLPKYRPLLKELLTIAWKKRNVEQCLQLIGRIREYDTSQQIEGIFWTEPPKQGKTEADCDKCDKKDCFMLGAWRGSGSLKDCRVFQPKQPEQPAGMTFMQAVEAMKAGGTVNRQNSTHRYKTESRDLVLYVRIFVPGTGWRDWVPSVADFEATDWEIVK